MESDLMGVSIAIEEALARARARPGDLRNELAPLRAERDRLIARARAAGLNNRQIAALAGVTRWAVIKVLKHGPVGAQRDGPDCADPQTGASEP